MDYSDDKVRFEIEREGSDDIVELEFEGEQPFDRVLGALGLEAATHLFERDKDEPLAGNCAGRRHMRLLAHSHRAIDVTVRYEQHSKDHRFPSSATVFKVLQWAVGKAGYRLDPTLAAKANLILPGAEQPLPRDRTIGSLTKPGHPELVVDLTLKDFTNGC